MYLIWNLTSQNSWSRNQPCCPVDNPDSATALLEWVQFHRRHTENTQARLKEWHLITLFCCDHDNELQNICARTIWVCIPTVPPVTHGWPKKRPSSSEANYSSVVHTNRNLFSWAEVDLFPSDASAHCYLWFSLDNESSILCTGKLLIRGSSLCLTTISIVSTSNKKHYSYCMSGDKDPVLCPDLCRNSKIMDTLVDTLSCWHNSVTFP